MPGATRAVEKFNHHLDGHHTEARSAALGAVSGAASIKDVIERSHFLEGMDEATASEVLAVLSALPPAIDKAFLATLQSTLERGIPVGIGWKVGVHFALRVEEITDEGAARVDIVLFTPNGRKFVKG